MSELPPLTVRVADIEREEQVARDWPLSLQWLAEALSDSEATPVSDGHVSVTCLKNGRDIIVHGKIRAEVDLPCARTLDPARYKLEPDLFLVMRKGSDPRAPQKPRTRAARAQEKQQKNEDLVEEVDPALETYSGDEIHLETFVREQLLLELPMFPLRSDLRSTEAAAIPPPSRDSDQAEQVDPRLLPLRAIADRLKQSK